MRSFNTLLVSTLSFVSLVASGPLHPNPHSSRLVANPISSRQFHHPRALVDVCADLRVIALPINIASLLDVTCLCLSAFPLGLDLYQLTALGMTEAGVEVDLQSLLLKVKDHGSQCTYPDHASPQCTSGNVCDFTCMDGFAKNGGSCVCPSPNSLCNGKCGFHPNGCSSALPSAPKMRRRSIAPSRRRVASGFVSRDSQAIDTNVGLDPDCTSPPSLTLSTTGPVERILADLGLGPVNYTLGATTNLTVGVSLALSDTLAGVDGLVSKILALIDETLNLLLDLAVQVNLESTPSIQAGDMIVGLDMSSLLNGTLSDANDIVNVVLLAVSEVVSEVVGYAVTVNFDGGSSCGCSGSRWASPKN
ncbi:hypothetical protein BJ322DRAFT_1105875 [Thelephora terrestris]|uniref:Uncharacterized protein n=1 Tax=Thelephora terrestris TaxID=56493 RepID=A0A9P6HI33_9AGAM|nr:hypothetical protein BJ322DRAFT_1105875 [Thelephora terrestris]